MKKKFSTIGIFSGLVMLLLLSGCSTVNVPIPVTHPAEIDMTSYKQIVLSEINGNLGGQFGDGVKNQLVESNRFKVVDRARLSQIMGELKLSCVSRS